MPYTDQQKQRLLKIARDSIKSGLETGEPMSVDIDSLQDALKKQRATFVTLHKQEELRGCVGTILARMPLAQDVAEHAYAAAFRDSRFMPLKNHELEQLDISISILSPPEPITFDDEYDLLEKIRPYIEGLILEENYNRGVFLPSVWEQLPDKKDFLRQLKRKAGLPADYWSDDIQVECFTTESFSEKDLKS